MIIQLEIEDSKKDIIFNIINNLKKDIIKKYQILDDKKENKDFISLSNKSLSKIWDNKEDSIYDEFSNKILKEQKC